jgi:tetratricopeptide (TPR) repeat protein
VATVRSYLGEGKFGSMFLVTDRSGARQYAVKCARLPPDESGSGVVHPTYVVKAYCNQLDANLRSSPHPNVLNLYKICKDDSPSAPANRHVIFYDVMEGCDLFSFLQKRRSVWLGATRSVHEIQQQLFSLIAQLVNGLIWIHSRGVLHCNIQPSNIMIDPAGQELHIAGFEMATVATRLDEQGQPVCVVSSTRTHGSNTRAPAYRSPEIAQAAGAPIEVCPRTSDLWAAALTILQMYCGGNCLWQDRFPRILSGEHGVRAMAAYHAIDKDRLFNVEYFADLVEFHGTLPEPLVNALRSCSFGSAMPDLTVRMLFGLSLYDESMLDDLRTHYSLNMGDVLRLRRIERQIFVLSMPSPLQGVLRAALSPSADERPASADAWQQRLLALHADHSQCLDDALVEIIHRAENIPCTEMPVEDKALSFVNLGHIFYGIVDLPSAKRCFVEALELSDHDAAVPALALYRLGKCYLAESDVARGRQLLERSIQSDNNFGKAHYALAKLARADGRIDELQHHLKRCVELDTMYDHPKPRWMLGQVLRLTGAVMEAIEMYEHCIAEYLGFAPAEAYSALEHFLDGDNEAAFDHAKSAFDIDSGDAVGSYLLAMLYQMRGDHGLARELFENALAASGGWCHVSMADLFWAYGAVEKAVECLQRGVQQFPDDEALVARLAELSALPQSMPCPSVQEVVARVSSHSAPNLVY